MNNIRNFRQALNISQSELASICGVHQTAVSCWELGNGNPEIEKLIILSKLFGVSIDQILGIDYPNQGCLLATNGEIYEKEIKHYDFNSFSYIASNGNKIDVSCFALTMKDDFMSPTIGINDIVIVNTRLNPRDKNIVLIKTKFEKEYIRRMIHQDNGIILFADNTARESVFYSDEEIKKDQIMIEGVITEIRRAI